MRRVKWSGVFLGLLGAVSAPAQDPGPVKVNYENVELEALAQQVEQVTKKTFLYPEQALKGKRVTLRAEKPVSPDELYRIFQSVCQMHGFALVPAPDENVDLVKIVPMQQAAKESGAQPVLGRGDALPRGEGLIYYVLHPKHISGTRATAFLTPALSPTGGVLQVPNSDMVLLIDTAAAVRRAEKLLSLVDVLGEPVRSVAIPLEHVSAARAKDLIGSHAQAFDKVSSGEAGRSRLEVLTDERLNQVHLIGREADVLRAQEYLKELDRKLPAVERTLGYYKLKNVPVLEVVDSVRQFLGLATELRDSESLKAQGIAPPLSGVPQRELSGAPALPPGVAPPAPPGTPAQAGPSPPPVNRRGIQATGAAPSSIAGAAAIEVIALESRNTLVVIGNASVHEEVKKILENLDKRRGQVLIEVAILQVTGDDSLDTGLEVLLEGTASNGASVQGGTGFGLSQQADPGGTGFPTLQTLAAGFSGGAFRYLKPQDISVLIRAISTRAHVNILSQPLLLVNENEDANFTTKVSEPTVVTSQGTVGNLTSFAGFADATTSLSILPQVSPDGYINLRITQSFEEFTGSASGSGVPPPKVSNNVTTFITVPDRHTAILGGFTRDAATDTRTGVPILMDVPLLGWLASQRTTRMTKSRLYLFVRPRILSTDGFSDLKEASQERARSVRPLMTDPRMRARVEGALAPWDSGIREAPLPIVEKK